MKEGVLDYRYYAAYWARRALGSIVGTACLMGCSLLLLRNEAHAPLIFVLVLVAGLVAGIFSELISIRYMRITLRPDGATFYSLFEKVDFTSTEVEAVVDESRPFPYTRVKLRDGRALRLTRAYRGHEEIERHIREMTKPRPEQVEALI